MAPYGAGSDEDDCQPKRTSATIRLDSLTARAAAERTGTRSFWDLPTLDELAEEQGIKPVERLKNLVSGFWPEDESVDDFLAAIESRD